jgi:RNA polymerase sigma-70 factor, ECF subfamily
VNGRQGGGRLIDLSRIPLPVATLNPASSAVSAPDVGEFAALYAEHFQFVWRCLRGLGVSGAQLEDAAQDVFVVIHRRLPTFEGSATLRTWIFGIVRRVAYRYRRSASRKPSGGTANPEAPTSDPGPHERAQDLQAAAFVDEFTSTLDHRKREVFVLGVLEGLPVPEIAEALGIPLNTAYTRLRRARAEFRKALAQRLETP